VGVEKGAGACGEQGTRKNCGADAG
jgi:hypothetical protein